MSQELKAQARALRAEIDQDNAKAAALYATFDEARKTAIAEGVDFTKNDEALERIDELKKPHSAKLDEIAAKEARWKKLMGWIADESPASGPSGEEKAAEFEERAARQFGKSLIDSPAWAAVKASGALENASARINTDFMKVMSREEFKTLIDSTAGSAGDFVRTDRRSYLVQVPSPDLSVLDLFTVTTTDSNTVEYMEETTFTNSAAETAEDTAAAESALVYDAKTSPVKDITHFIPATKRILQDESRLQSLIDARMIYGVQKRLQAQCIAGDAAGENLRGLINVAGINAQALGADSRTDAVHKAITKILVQGEGNYDPRTIGIHPDDWEQLRLEKDANGNYILGPATGAVGTVWGLTPVVHTAFTSGNPVVGDYKGAELAIRSGVELAVSDSHSDYFTKRKVAVLATIRAAFFVPWPKAFTEITGF